MLSPEKKETYFVKASLLGKNKRIDNIPCKIFLPERIYDTPSVFFIPADDTQAALIMSLNGGKFVAEVIGFDKKVCTTIQASEMHCSNSGTTYWGDNLSEAYAHGEPQHLMITEHRSSSELNGKTEITFWISPNELLTPFISSDIWYTGEIKTKRGNCVEFQINHEITLKFDLHFKTKNIGSDEILRWSYLVACAEICTAATNLDEIREKVLPHLDDFLLIASFAAGIRTACVGWTADDDHSHTTYYRGKYTFPKQPPKQNIQDCLPNRSHTKEFIENCYASFLDSENKLALRSAIYAAVPLQPHSLESSFLSMFAGLETLLLAFRRQNSLEKILPNEEWKKLKKSLANCIKNSSDPKLTSEQIASVYNKLEELNRISLKEAFDIFRQNYGIYLSDLWPVFGEKEAIGLVNIRNKLIHGDPFPMEMIQPLSIANIHLQITLERSLVRVLGWDIAKTKVSPALLNHPISDFSTERKKLTEYVNN